MRSIAYSGQVLMAIIAIIIFVSRRQIDEWFSLHIPSRKKLVFILVTLCLSTILSLAMMEIGLRLFRDPLRITWKPADHKRVQYDSTLGWTYIPNQSVMQTFVKNQSPVPVYTNEQGIRVPTPETKLDPNRPSVIFVGGSYTMGYGLPFEDTFIGKLAEYPNFPYQVVNLGVEAYGTDQAWLRLKRHIKMFTTIAVVYTFLPAHIDRNMNYDRRLLFPGVRMVGTKPLFGLKRDGSVYLKNPPVRLENYSPLRLWVIIQRIWLKWGPEPSLKKTYALIDAMGKEVEMTGALFILVYWDFWDNGTSAAHQAINNISFPFIDLCTQHPVGWPEMRLPNDSHPNTEASIFVARRLAAKLQELGLINME